MRIFQFLLFALLLLTTWPAEAKRDSVALARKAERQQKKEEYRREAELQRLAEPHFKGGDIDRFEAWVVSNLRLDYGAFPPGVPHIQLEVPFWVEADGTVSLSDEEYSSKNLYPRLVQEVERVILFSPEWEPGHDPLGNPIRTHQLLRMTLNSASYDPLPAARPAPRPMRRLRR